MIKDYVLLLLLIAPGFLCKGLYAWLNEGMIHKNEDGLKLIIKSLIFNIGILGLNYPILCIVYHKFWKIDEISRQLERVPFIFLYIGITLVACIFMAILLDLLKPLSIGFLNSIRRLRGKPALTGKGTVWDEIVADESNRAVVIERNREELFRGIVEVMSYAADGEKELFIKKATTMPKSIPDEAIKGVYLDFSHDLLIKILDPEKLDPESESIP